MTSEQIALAKALNRCSLPVATAKKAFIRNMGSIAEHDPGREISGKQDKYLRDLAYHFRRQMPIDLVLKQEPHTWSTLQWMAPELAKLGLLRNEPWVPEHAAQAVDLYQKDGPQTAAALFAALHKHALDYLLQAPVIALGISKGSPLSKAVERKEVAGMFAPRLRDGLSLRQLMKDLKLPYPLRKLSGFALVNVYWKAIKQFRGINHSSISQMIPPEPADQARWFERLTRFDAHIRRRTFEADDAQWNKLLPQIFEWAAWHFGTDWPQNAPNFVTEIGDYLAANPERFNPRWTLQRMIDEARAWHNYIATASAEERWRAQTHLPWEYEVDYSPLPHEVRIEEFTFAALRSAKALFEEGQAMHHCVGSYASDVLKGSSRIYAVTNTETAKKLATLEFTTNAWRQVAAREFRDAKIKNVWTIAQCKGPCNEAPSTEIGIAASKLLARINGQPTVYIDPDARVSMFARPLDEFDEAVVNTEARVVYP